LNAVVDAVGYIDDAVCRHLDGMRQPELLRTFRCGLRLGTLPDWPRARSAEDCQMRPTSV
jgi:hypothetical protein